MAKQLFLALLLLFLQTARPLLAQDPIFSQPYMVPVYLNPATTGSGDYDLRVSGIYRRQWWKVPSQFTYTAVSIEKFLPSVQSGIGLLFTNSREGYIGKSGLYASYAFTICPEVLSPANDRDPQKWFLTGAVQAGIVQRRIDYGNLLFADQLNSDGIIPFRETNADQPISSGKTYADMGAGLLFSILSANDIMRWVAGVSVSHINRPNESFISTDSLSQLPVLWKANIMYVVSDLDKVWSKTFMINAGKQRYNNFLQVGIQLTHNTFDFGFGCSYRASYNQFFKEPDAFTLSASINISGRRSAGTKMTVGVAHDLPVGRNRLSNTSGTSEFGFTWDQNTNDNDSPCKPKISDRFACPQDQRSYVNPENYK